MSSALSGCFLEKSQIAGIGGGGPRYREKGPGPLPWARLPAAAAATATVRLEPRHFEQRAAVLC